MNVIKSVFTDWKIAKRLLITLLLIFLFRWGTLITIPGINFDEGDIDQSSFIGIMNMLGGGGISKFSIFAMGVSPYITASIIIQLLSSDVIPYLTRLTKQGEKGSIKIEKITRVLTIAIAIVQSLALIIAFDAAGKFTDPSGSPIQIGTTELIGLTMIMVSGSMISLWIADQITTSGVGNGTSIIILIGIVARMPTLMLNQFLWFTGSTSSSEQLLTSVIQFSLYLLFTATLIWLIAYFETSQRRIPIQQTGQGLNLVNDKQTYLPIKINPAGVIPVIFASSIMSLPGTIAQFFQGSAGSFWVTKHFALTDPFGLSIYTLLLILFTFFYAHININSEQISENFQKSSTFIIGVTPGEETEKYISSVVTSLSVIGSAFLTLLAITPYLLTFLGMPRSIAVGGTSMIILVSVSMDTWEQLQARVIASNTTVKQKEKIHKKKNDSNSHTILFD